MKTYYHYTNQEGYEGILATGVIRPSLRIQGATYGDAVLGEGIYLTSITPEEIAAARSDEYAMNDIIYELFNITETEAKLAYFFELNLLEEEIIDFVDVYARELGKNPQDLTPDEIRRVYLYTTDLGIEIGTSRHGTTLNI